MVLIDYQIRKLCEGGLVTPYDESLVNPSSLDIRIGYKIILMRLKDKIAYHYILEILEKARMTDCEQVLHNFIPQLNNLVSWQEIDITTYTESNPFWLFPEDRILTESLETFYFPDNICGQFRLKSSRGREFYEHLEAGWIDNGWSGSKLTMEIENRSLSCLPLYPKLKMGQIILFETEIPNKSYKLMIQVLRNQRVNMQDNIKPSHYKLTVKEMEIEVIDIINASNLSYNMGTAFAYLLRAGKKRNCPYQEDISKAIKHLEFELNKIDVFGLLPIIYPIVIKGQEIEPLDIIDSCSLQFMQEACIFKMLSPQPDLYSYKKDVNILISMLKLSLKGDEE